jgi:SAM-dependent methyltransferase
MPVHGAAVTSVPSDTSRIARERAFWNQRARHSQGSHPDASLNADEVVRADDRCDSTVPWLPYLGMPRLIGRLLDEVGDVRGLSVLDIGTGTGFLTALLAVRGAQVDAIDVSEASLEVAGRRARASNVAGQVRLHVMPGEVLSFPDNAFDRAVGVFVLHHLDLARAAPEIHRVLRPGGTAVFIETWGGNPLLMAARRFLTGRFGIEKASSDDERPLGRDALRQLAAGGFARVDYVFPDLLFLRMLCYLPSGRAKPVQRVLEALDAGLRNIPGLRRFSYFCVVVLSKAPEPPGQH